MSRPSVPRIQPTDLRDVASEERVERIWGRLEQDLVTVRAKPAARSSRAVVWAVAATFAAFGVGLFVGRVVYKERPVDPSAVVATNDRATVDLYAAGTQPRTYSLPGGGSITLAPGSMIELERAGSGGDLRLRLVAGEASLDTAQGADQALAIVSGEATVATAPGSTVHVRQRADNLDVRVVGGSAEVSSPAGRQALRRGEQIDDVPTRRTTTSNDPPVVRVSPVHTGRMPRGDASVAQVAVAPSWREQYAAGKFDEALDLLKQQPGGISGAVDKAKSDQELMAISEVARIKGGDSGAALTALKRVADEFGSTANGSIAARQLSKHYEAAGQPDLAKKYLAQAAQKGVFGEDALCDQMLSEDRAAHKDEAVARASEYLGKYPNGRCKDDAIRIRDGGDADGDEDPPSTAETATAPAPSAPPSAPAQKPSP